MDDYFDGARWRAPRPPRLPRSPYMEPMRVVDDLLTYLVELERETAREVAKLEAAQRKCYSCGKRTVQRDKSRCETCLLLIRQKAAVAKREKEAAKREQEAAARRIVTCDLDRGGCGWDLPPGDVGPLCIYCEESIAWNRAQEKPPRQFWPFHTRRGRMIYLLAGGMLNLVLGVLGGLPFNIAVGVAMLGYLAWELRGELARRKEQRQEERRRRFQVSVNYTGNGI